MAFCDLFLGMNNLFCSGANAAAEYAISENDDYRFILIKELEGYNHKEIAEMMVAKRKKENKVTFYDGKIVVPDAHYVDMNKARALKEVKAIVEQIKKDWYENK